MLVLICAQFLYEKLDLNATKIDLIDKMKFGRDAQLIWLQSFQMSQMIESFLHPIDSSKN